MLAAGLDGVDQKLTCPKPLNSINIFHLTSEERHQMGVTDLPGSLAEAFRQFKTDEVLRVAPGSLISESYKRVKWAEVEESRMRVTDWELARYLDVA